VNRKSLLANYSVLHAPREINPLLRELHRLGWNITAHIGWFGQSADETARDLAEGGFKIISPTPKLSYVAHVEPAAPRVRRHGRQLVGQFVPRWVKLLWHTGRDLSEVFAMRRRASEIFDQVRPSVFLSNNFHSCGRLDNALLAEAKRRGILTVCVLVSPLVSKYIAMPGRLNQYRAGMTGETLNVGYYGLASKLLARVVSDWTVTDGEVSLFMWPLPRMLATRLAGLLPSDVWQTPHEDFDVVFAPNTFSKELLSKSDYPMHKVQVLGAPRLDEALTVARDPLLRQQLYERLSLAPESAYILWNVEPSWEHSYCSEERHWQWVHNVARVLKARELPVVVSLHPLCSPERYSFLNSDYGFCLSRDYGIHQLYPLAGFVVTFPCSTNQYASIFGKRLVMYDWFGASTSPARSELYILKNMRVATTVDELERIVSEEAQTFAQRQHAATGSDLPEPASPRIASKIEELWSSLPEVQMVVAAGGA
jgi:hypothetical protein